MAITSVAQITAAQAQRIVIAKAITTSVATTTMGSSWGVGGRPTVAGAYGPAYTAGSGYTYSKASTGAPQFNAAATKNYISRVSMVDAAAQTNVGQILLVDRLWACSGMGFAASTYTVTTPGSLPARITDSGVGCEMWLSTEGGADTNAAGNATINYLNTAGSAKSVTVAVSGTWPAGEMMRCPLAAGDLGASQIVSVVTDSSWTAGTFGVVIAKQIFKIPLRGRTSVSLPWRQTGLPSVHDDACLQVIGSRGSNGTAINTMTLELVDL